MMKKCLKRIGAWTLSLALASCSMDAYDKGESEYSLMTAEVVDAYVGSDLKVVRVETDQGEALTMNPPITAKWIEKGDTVYRALLYYSMGDPGKAEPVSINRVGVLTPRDLSSLSDDGTDRETNMKTDPLHFESAWKGKNGSYLNLRLRLMTGATDDEKSMHIIGVINDSTASTSRTASMVLYHDQGGMPEYYSATVFASIPLTDIGADTLVLHVNTYDGWLTRTFVLKGER